MTEETTHIEGIVERVVFENIPNGYVVFRLDCEGELITAVGNIGKVDEGENLVLDGRVVVNKKYGQQFQAEYCERKLPDTSINIEKFLASGAIKGISKGIARRIISVFGDDTLNIIEKTPERLIEVKGISPKKCKEITEEARKLFSLREINEFLSGFGVKNLYAMRFYQKYGTNSIDIIKENPYILCESGIELDFQKADEIAENLGIPKNSEMRISAGINYTLCKFSENNNTCMPVEYLAGEAMNILEISEDDFYKVYEKAVDEGDVNVYIIGDTEYVYLPEYFIAESNIADKIYELCKNRKSTDIDVEKMIDEEEKSNGMKYNQKQREAITTAISDRIVVITGGPGTGKTTTLNAIISILRKKKEVVYLAAPTGRAAKRMSELTGQHAKTIHRMLDVQFSDNNTFGFFHNGDNPLECDTVIIDEMSMVDCMLFEGLLDALPEKCRLVMVGDFNQLPSVKAGNVLEDIITSGVVPVVELTEIFRQAQKSNIVTNAHKIVHGQYPDLTRKKESDFFFFPTNNYENAIFTIITLAHKRLPENAKYSPDDIQVISPSKEGVVGTKELNKRLQEVLNPHDDEKAEYKSESGILRVGDKVMQMQNNYDIVWRDGTIESAGIFNGDIGKITEIDTKKQIAIIDFDGRLAEYPFDLLQQIDLAYAITVHKSQGCEFKVVIMPVMDGFEKLSYRSLLYTAVTRAKEYLILIGSESKIHRMVDNNKHTERLTCLKDMLIKKGQA